MMCTRPKSGSTKLDLPAIRHSKLPDADPVASNFTLTATCEIEAVPPPCRCVGRAATPGAAATSPSVTLSANAALSFANECGPIRIEPPFELPAVERHRGHKAPERLGGRKESSPHPRRCALNQANGVFRTRWKPAPQPEHSVRLPDS